jgi:uncharacterized membrane protein YciS (DUF1049 family)
MKKNSIPFLALIAAIACVCFAIKTQQSVEQITLLSSLLFVGFILTYVISNIGHSTLAHQLENAKALKKLENLEIALEKQSDYVLSQQDIMRANSASLTMFSTSISELFNQRLTEEYACIKETKEEIKQSLGAFEVFFSSFNNNAEVLVKQFIDTQTAQHQSQLNQTKHLEAGITSPLNELQHQFTRLVEAHNTQSDVMKKNITELSHQLTRNQTNTSQDQLTQLKSLETSLVLPLAATTAQMDKLITAQEHQSQVTQETITALMAEMNQTQLESHQNQKQVIELTKVTITENQTALSNTINEVIEDLDEKLNEMVESLGKKLTKNNAEYRQITDKLTFEVSGLIQDQQAELLTSVNVIAKELKANRDEFSEMTAKDIKVMERMLNN